MTDELKQWEYDKGYEKGKKHGAIEELEKIKAEILKKVWRDAQGQIVMRDGFNHGIITATDIIDNHIEDYKKRTEGVKD